MRTKASGEITVFLSLILVMMMSLCFTLLESARSEGLKLRVQLAANAGIESVFAGYDRFVWDEYGLLFFANRDGEAKELSEIALSYAQENSGTDWLSFSANSVDVKNYVTAVDDDGEVFIKAVSDYMTSCGLIEAAIENADSAKSISGQTIDATDDEGEIDLSKLKEKIKNAESEMQDVKNDEESEAEYEISDEAAKEKYDELKETFNNWVRRGLLGTVCDDVGNISESRYDFTDAPSKLSDSRKSRSVADVGDVSSLDVVLYKEYLMRQFDDYQDRGADGLQLEYIICGKDSDLANMSSIAMRIMAIRSGIDYARIRTDGAKVSEALAIATAVAGWTLIPSIVTAIKEVVLIIWAISDAITDTRQILNGEKDGDGLSYKDYLRAFLYLSDSSKTAYRAMDVMQRDICKNEKAFRMSNCIYAANIILNAEASSMFPFLPAGITYNFQMSSAYSYGKVNEFY